MQTATFSRAMTLLFLLVLTVFLIVQNVSKPRVLILHSYYTDFSWVQDINVGINRILEKKSYKVRWHYMDTKRHPDQDFMVRAGNTVRNMIDSWQPDIIIAIDDNAQQYVARYYVNHPKIKIVFTGLNKTEKDYGYDQATNVTGMLERINYQAVKDILLQVLPPDRRRVLHVSDVSNTSEGIHNEIVAFDWAPLQLLDSIQTATFDDWKKVIHEAEGKTDFLLLTHYHTIKESPTGSIVPPKEIIKWTNANSALPGISFWGFYVEDGGMMAVALSPYEQGEIAAKMTVNIIENATPPKQISVETSHLFVMYMRDSEIKTRLGSLNLPLVYEAFAKATNNYYE
jgi:ABC-type uncharacterized transport system substrate-binding protein